MTDNEHDNNFLDDEEEPAAIVPTPTVHMNLGDDRNGRFLELRAKYGKKNKKSKKKKDPTTPYPEWPNVCPEFKNGSRHRTRRAQILNLAESTATEDGCNWIMLSISKNYMRNSMQPFEKGNLALKISKLPEYQTLLTKVTEMVDEEQRIRMESPEWQAENKKNLEEARKKRDLLQAERAAKENEEETAAADRTRQRAVEANNNVENSPSSPHSLSQGALRPPAHPISPAPSTSQTIPEPPTEQTTSCTSSALATEGDESCTMAFTPAQQMAHVPSPPPRQESLPLSSAVERPTSTVPACQTSPKGPIERHTSGTSTAMSTTVGESLTTSSVIIVNAPTSQAQTTLMSDSRRTSTSTARKRPTPGRTNAQRPSPPPVIEWEVVMKSASGIRFEKTFSKLDPTYVGSTNALNMLVPGCGPKMQFCTVEEVLKSGSVVTNWPQRN